MIDRVDLINRVCSRYEQPAYLELGCRDDHCFAWVKAATKIGIDPEWGGTMRLTSDEFFAHTVVGPFDVIFIDGLHLSEQARRDVQHSLERLKPDGTIVMHDCLPDNAWHADPQRARDLIAAGDTGLHGIGEWCGDVWKVLVEMNQRADVDVALWPGDHGCGLMRRRPSRALRWAPRTVEEYRAGYENWIVQVADEKGLDEWLDI